MLRSIFSLILRYKEFASSDLTTEEKKNSGESNNFVLSEKAIADSVNMKTDTSKVSNKSYTTTTIYERGDSTDENIKQSKLQREINPSDKEKTNKRKKLKKALENECTERAMCGGKEIKSASDVRKQLPLSLEKKLQLTEKYFSNPDDQVTVMLNQVRKIKTGMERLHEIAQKFNNSSKYTEDIEFLLKRINNYAANRTNSNIEIDAERKCAKRD